MKSLVNLTLQNQALVDDGDGMENMTATATTTASGSDRWDYEDPWMKVSLVCFLIPTLAVHGAFAAAVRREIDTEHPVFAVVFQVG